MKPKKICLQCKHHKYDVEWSGALCCGHPKMEGKMIAVTMLREMGNSYQTAATKRSLKEICGKEGKWHEKI